jgi:tellurite resistance protein TehA-like permease
MHAMVCLWLLFSLMLFVVEPIIARRHLRRRKLPRPDRPLKWLQRGHWPLVTLGVLTVLGAVAGSQGWAIF